MGVLCGLLTLRVPRSCLGDRASLSCRFQRRQTRGLQSLPLRPTPPPTVGSRLVRTPVGLARGLRARRGGLGVMAIHAPSGAG